MIKYINLLEILRDGKTPFLKVFAKKNSFEKSNVGVYDCQNCDNDESESLKTEKAIEWLNFITEKFEPGTVFLLTAAKYQKSNQTGISGPFEFVRDDLKPQNENNEQVSGLNGFDPERFGYMRPGEVEAKLLAQQIEFNNELHRKQIEDLQKEFKQNAENIETAAKAWNPEALKGLISEAVQGFALLTGKNGGQQLGAVPEHKEPTMKELLLQQFTEELKDLEINEITVIKNSISNLIKNKNSADNGKEKE